MVSLFDISRSLRRTALLTTMLTTAALALLAPASAQAGGFLFGIQANNTVLVDGNPAAQRAAVRDVAKVGAQVLRVTLSWKRVARNSAACTAATSVELQDPMHACYDWTVYDTVVDEASKDNIRVLASIYQVPEWVLGNDQYMFMGNNDSDFAKLTEHWAAFSRAAAERYDGEGFGTINYYTVGNEPNSKRFWTPYNSKAPCRFATLYMAAAPAIRAGYPKVKVAPGPIGPKPDVGDKPVNYYKKFLPCLGAASRAQVDALAHNPYPPTILGPRAVGPHKLPVIGMTNFGELPKLMDRYPATRGKPIWATEFAYQSNPPDRFGVSLEKQATYLADSFDVLHKTGRVEIANWYVFRDNTDLLHDWQSGLVTAKGARKPSYEMYRRPIARNFDVVKRGQAVRVWGASMVGAGPRVYWSYNGRSWKRAARQKRSGRIAVTTLRPVKSIWVRVQDSKGKGPKRKIVVQQPRRRR